MMTKPEVKAFYEPTTCTISYVVADPVSRHVAVIDPVLDYDPKGARTKTTAADELIDWIRTEGLIVDWLLETHVHADHLSAAPYLKQQVGGQTAIGAPVQTVQTTFKRLFNLEPGFATDGRQFDHLLSDGEVFAIGSIQARALHTPGHTPACVSYWIGDAVFTGDTVFMPDFGTARTDFPGGNAATLYRSIRRILSLPPDIRVFVGHDYGPGGRAPAWETTVAAQRATNIHIRDGISEAEFVALRTARDRSLDLPALILPSIQVNLRGGQLPPPEANGVSYLKIPINSL